METYKMGLEGVFFVWRQAYRGGVNNLMKTVDKPDDNIVWFEIHSHRQYRNSNITLHCGNSAIA